MYEFTLEMTTGHQILLSHGDAQVPVEPQHHHAVRAQIAVLESKRVAASLDPAEAYTMRYFPGSRQYSMSGSDVASPAVAVAPLVGAALYNSVNLLWKMDLTESKPTPVL